MINLWFEFFLARKCDKKVVILLWYYHLWRKEYVAYLKEFGNIRFFATEWTVLNAKGYRNVVEATNDEKSVNESFPKGFLVLENLGIDAKMVVVNEKGKVYFAFSSSSVFSFFTSLTCISPYFCCHL